MESLEQTEPYLEVLNGCMPGINHVETTEIPLGLALLVQVARAREEREARLRVAIDGPKIVVED